MSADGIVVKGVGALTGIAIGKAVLLDRRRVTFHKIRVPAAQYDSEIERLRGAIDASVAQLRALRQQVADTHGGDHVEILDAHELMLKDDMLVSGTIQLIREEGLNAEWALFRTLESIKEFFNRLEDEYFRERRSDIEFVGDRVMRNLTGQTSETLMELLARLNGPSVLVAFNLSPAETIQLRNSKVVGFCTAEGTRTAHTAIVARSLEIPAVVGARGIVESVVTGDVIVVDGGSGEICIRPSKKQSETFRRAQKRLSGVRQKLVRNKRQDSVTRDGFEVRLTGNIDLLEEMGALRAVGGQGIGLYRTEYLFLNRRSLPSEAEQYAAYKEVLKGSAPHAATIRTLDIGGDKLDFQGSISAELNPFFGLRAIRYCLKEKTLFRTQLRALLRASVHGRLKLLIPFITDVTEIREVKWLLDEVKTELIKEGKAFSRDVELGAMIEIPSAAMIADILAREVQFFSVGTNDLIQYTLAIARDTTEMGYLYHPLHPAHLRMLQIISDTAHREGIRLTMCGEMAGAALYTVVLLGLRFHELSMSPRSIPVVREIVQRSSLSEARDFAKQLFQHATYREVESQVWDYMNEHFADLLPLLEGEMSE